MKTATQTVTCEHGSADLSACGLCLETPLLKGEQLGGRDLSPCRLLDRREVPDADRGLLGEPLSDSRGSDANLSGEVLPRASWRPQVIEFPLQLSNSGFRYGISVRGTRGIDNVDGFLNGILHRRENSSCASIESKQRRSLSQIADFDTVSDMKKDYRKAQPTRADERAAKRLKTMWQSMGRDKPTQESLAARFGSGGSQSLISQYMRGTIGLNARALLFFAQEFRCKASDIYPDHPDLHLIEQQSISALSLATQPTNEEGVRIPRFGVRGSMGVGLPVPEHETIVGEVMVSKDWLRNEMRSISNASNLAILTGYGDSMEGTFTDGAQLIIDCGVREVKVDSVYVLALNDELYVKRLQRRPNGSILMISDNRKYDPYLIDDEELERFRVLGRVVGVWNFSKI